MAVVLAVKNTDDLKFFHFKVLYAYESTTAPKAPTAAASAGVANPAKIVPRTKRINENSGKNETMTSLIILDLGGISSSLGFGAIEGLKYALTTT